MTTIWVKIIREKATGKREVFRTVHENYVPDGWELDSVLEIFTIGGHLPYGENNPYIKAAQEKKTKEDRQAIGCCLAMAGAILLFIIAVIISM